jgi:hypothetical protein
MARWSALCVVLVTLASCGSPSWPDERFPKRMEVERTLFSVGSYGMNDACEAMVVELTDTSAVRLAAPNAMQRDGWRASPLVLGDGETLYARGALGGCNNGQRPIGDLEGALNRPGAYYKLVNGGEGLAVIVPRSKLAGWFYFG